MEYAELTKSIINDNTSFLDNCVTRLGESCDKFSFHDSVGNFDMQYIFIHLDSMTITQVATTHQIRSAKNYMNSATNLR